MNASSTKEIHKNGSIKKPNLVTKHVKEFKEKVKNEDVKEKENNNDNIGAKEVKDKQVKEKQNNKPAVNNNKTEASNLTWYTGTCKWFNNTKGWGFVNLTVAEDVTNSGEGEDDLPSGDIFVHQASIKKEGFRSLNPGEEVQFQVQSDRCEQKFRYLKLINLVCFKMSQNQETENPFCVKCRCRGGPGAGRRCRW